MLEGSSIAQLLVYLIVPVVLGYEFFLCARSERDGREEAPIGSIVLDFFGVVFMGVVPAVFIFTLWAVHSDIAPLQQDTVHRLQRYGVMFLFLGAYWQVYIYAALKARMSRKKDASLGKTFWMPFLLMGVFTSIVVAWNFPWHLDIVSVVWFLMLSGLLALFRVRPITLERIFWVLAVLTFFVENIVFVWFNAIV